MNTTTLNYYRRETGEAVRDALRDEGFRASLFGRWNVNGGGVKVQHDAFDAGLVRVVADVAAIRVAQRDGRAG